MPQQQTKQAEAAPKRSIDALLSDLKSKPSISEIAEKNDNATAANRLHSRRKNIDRRDVSPLEARGSSERREQINRRTKKAIEKKNQTEILNQRKEMKVQQHRKKILLAGCEPLMGFNFNALALDDYPDNALVSGARHDRDSWLGICAVFTSVFFFGVIGFVPPWLSGTGAGLAFLSAIFAFTPFRSSFFSRPHLHVLLNERKKLEFTALSHIQLLEGRGGLAWRCSKLEKYNSNLKRRLFSGLFYYSKKRQLLDILKNKKHIRLYLLLMVESQKAYKRLEKDYLQHHFKHLDDGWDDRVSEDEALALERTLNNSETT